MKRLTQTLLLAVFALLLHGQFAQAQDATEIMKKSHMAYYFAGNDGIAEVTMKLVDKKGGERIREFTMLRLDKEDGGDQKYYTYFKKPSDVSRLTFMVYKNSTGTDQRWIYVPSVDLVKPISADDKNSSFVGSDFSYEDVSGRHWSEDNHKLLPDGQVDGKAVYVIESTPIKPYKGFAKRISYIDKETYLPLQEEYFDAKGEMIRRLHADKIEVIDNIPTVTIRTMESLKKGSKTTVDFSKITYNLGLKDDLFTERYLKTPPREYIK
jgi:outer membrane lipoprotein-sorting protein